jgi:septal ring factor EnvC (AmiA/AmiB activator)
MTGSWVSVGLILAGMLGAGTFGYSLLQQTALQGQINGAMQVINQSIDTTGQIVKQTSVTLDPLTETTQSLAEIQQQEEQVVQHIAAMNASLEWIAKSETGIITGLESLNQVTQSASMALYGMGQTNSSILQASSLSAQQGNQEAGQVAELNRLTQYSIVQLKEMNDKLYMLRQLP